jgi:glyoxylase I family protein
MAAPRKLAVVGSAERTRDATPSSRYARQNIGMAAAAIVGLGHLDFTVTDGDRAMRWWEQVMGFQLLAKWEQPGYRGWTMVHPSGLGVTAVTHDEGDAGAFDERRVGLDHVAFRVSDLAALEAWEERLDALGVTHSGVQDVHGQRGGPLIVLRDPDNIQIELTAGWQPSV